MTSPKVCFIIFSVYVAIFMASYSASYAAIIKGYQIPVVCCITESGKRTLASWGGDSLSVFTNFNFSYTMPKSKEKLSRAKNSTPILPSTGTKSVELQFNEMQAKLIARNDDYIKLLEENAELWNEKHALINFIEKTIPNFHISFVKIKEVPFYKCVNKNAGKRANLKISYNKWEQR